MPRRSRLSIPHELHQTQAKRIYENRIAEGRNGSPEGDWEQAANDLTNHWWIVRTWQLKKAISKFFRRLWRSFKGLIGITWKILAFPFWLFYKLPQLFANTDTQLFALDVVKTIISAASLIAAIIAAFGLLVNYQDALKNRELTQERLVTDRFAKAIEQLGNDKEEVVLGGIYSLERIAKDSPKDQWMIMEVLTAFVRQDTYISWLDIRVPGERPRSLLLPLPPPPPLPVSPSLDAPFKPVNIPIQAALKVIGRRNSDGDYISSENPQRTYKSLDLSYANLSYANLSYANLSSAKLRSAQLRSAQLSRSFFLAADLSSAYLSGAYLSGAYLLETFLLGANLKAANLERANLNNANLTYANLKGAVLNDAKNLSNKQIKSACFWESAIYTDANWDYKEYKWIVIDEKANQKKIEAIKQDKASDPKNLPNCSLLK